MAVTLASDLKVYEAQFQSGLTETLQQNVDVFNGASNGAIVMRSSTQKGNYEYNAYFSAISNLVSRQDITSVAALTPTKIAQIENIAVKLHRKSASDLTYKSAKMAGISFDEMVFAHGQQVAKAYTAQMVNAALLSARVALANQADVTNDITGATVKSVNHSALIKTLAKFGDQSDRVACWVMHSTQFFDLGIQALADDIVNVADGIVRRIDVPGLGRPILVTDSPALIATADTPDSYFVLGLVQGGVDVNESEGIQSVVEQVTGLEQLVFRAQSEMGFNLALKGFKWDVGNGGANPDDTALGTGSNWDKIATDVKDLAGVVLKCQAAA